MLYRLLLFIIIIAFSACSNSNKESAKVETPKEIEIAIPDGVIIKAQSEVDTLKGSPKAYAVGKIGDANFTINYYSPATRGRMIWGGLVAYDNVWVTGAHKATNIKFDRDVKIGNTVVPAGTYAFFTIPGKEEWTIILNKNWNQHLADDYSQAEDVLRLNVVPEIEEKHQERLRYVIETESDTAGEIVMYWEKLKISIPIEVTQ